MTKYISLTNLKGGVGKSTLAIHLVGFLLEQNKSVLMVDADLPQSTLAAWGSIFKHPNLKIAKARNAEQVIEIYKKARNQFDFVVTDSPPRIAAVLKAILFVNDLVIMPLNATAPDVWAIKDVNDVLNDAVKSKPTPINLYIAWNMVIDTNKSKAVRDTVAQENKFKQFDTALTRLIGYSDSIGIGSHAVIHSHAKCKQQMNALGHEILNVLKD